MNAGFTPDPSLPKVFGRYLLLRRLSRGGMGEIFLAKSGQLTGFEKLCVIKKILPNLAEDREFIRRFIDEASVAINLQHANIAPVFEVGMVEGEYFLALEYIDGRDLRRMLARLHERQQRLPPDVALWLVREVAAGLGYAHRRTDAEGRPLNVVHCDISPPNVVVSLEGEVKIIDFGIAKSAMRISATNPGMGFGKFGYMAPEQLVRGGVVDRRTDIYAAGVLLYELATGERLFQFPEGTDYRAIARAVAAGEHQLPSQREPTLIDFDPIVKKALAPIQDNRYSAAEQLRDDVQMVLARLNPTLTADRIGAFIRQLFADEIAEERGLLAQASAVDLTPWVDQLTGARTHTVSFALSEKAPEGQGVTTAGGGIATVDHSGTMLVPKGDTEPQGKRRGRNLIVAGAVGIGSLVTGVALALALTGDKKAADQQPTIVQVQQQPFVVQEMPAVEPDAKKQPDSNPTQAADVAPKQTPKQTPVKKPVVVRTAPKPKPEPVRHDASAAQVQAKFKAVKGEYAGFKKRYGSRLEAEWSDILNTATYESGDDRYRKLDAKLDKFRRKMGEIQKE